LTNIRAIVTIHQPMEEVVMLLMVVGDAVSSFFIHLSGLRPIRV